jgi:hypothetical protein
MYSARKATKQIKGYMDLIIENKTDNAIELAAAWGLMARKALSEKWAINGDTVTFRMKQSTFEEWLDIVKSVTESGEGE